MRRGLALVTMLAGCYMGATRVGGKPYKPFFAEAPEGVKDTDLYASTVRIFTDQGWDVLEKDADAGIVTSKLIRAGMAEDSTDAVYHAWRVTIAEGRVRVEIGCMFLNDYPGSRPHSCGESGERKARFIDTAPELAQMIIADATKRSERRKEREASAEPEH